MQQVSLPTGNEGVIILTTPPENASAHRQNLPPLQNTTLPALSALADVAQYLRSLSMTLSQLMVLHAVDQAGREGITPNSRTLAMAMGGVHASTWRRTSELSAKGLIRSARTPGVHGISLTVTPRGRDVLEAAEAVLATAPPHVVSGQRSGCAASKSQGRNGASPTCSPVRPRVRNRDPVYLAAR